MFYGRETELNITVKLNIPDSEHWITTLVSFYSTESES